MGSAKGGLHPGGLPRGGQHPGGSASRGGLPRVVEQTPLPPVNRMTQRCKSITLPQTSFAGGKNCRS